jgi:hypothetical protein
MAIDVRATAARSVRVAGRLAGRVLSYALTAMLIVLAVGSAVGRIRLAPAPVNRMATPYAKSDLVVVVPVPAQRVKAGDVLYVHSAHEHSLLRVDRLVDSTTSQVHIVGDPQDKFRHLAGTAWRVSGSVPFAGLALDLIAGPIPALLFVLFGLALVVRAEMQRGREDRGGGARAPVPVASGP